MASKIAKRLAERLTITMPADNIHAEEVAEIAVEIDAAIQEASKPLVEAVLEYASKYPAPSYSVRFDDLANLVAEARKLKGDKL
jgi:hypothetical protein